VVFKINRIFKTGFYPVSNFVEQRIL